MRLDADAYPWFVRAVFPRSARRPMPLVGGLACAWVLAAPATAFGQAAAPAAHDDEAFDVMNVLADAGLHDIHDERWNLYGQATTISSWKARMPAAYTNLGGTPNSLLPTPERSFTHTFSIFAGVRLWPGAEAYFNPEVISLRPLSNLHGLGGAIQNFELQRGGTETPQLYRARTFLRQTIPLGGTPVEKTSDPLQLAATTTSRRVVLTAGNFTLLDVFDRNTVTGDPRQTFLNMAFMTHASWDFPADARGYTWGATAELDWDDWAVRIGHAVPPIHPNQLETDFRFWKFFGDALEVEHTHSFAGHAGAVKVLGYRNRVNSGRFDDAIAAWMREPTQNATTCTGFNYGSANANAPDLCWVRRPNVKVGLGIDIEQNVARGIGVFVRGMFSDGKSEVESFNAADRSLSFGTVAKGALWGRALDVTGFGLAASWISKAHADYLALGGVDGFVGDGALRHAAEMVGDVFYSVNLLRALWLTADVQVIANPGFNADRGPVAIVGGRAHAEF